MSLRFLLDTNVLSEAARPRPDAGVLERLQHHSQVVCTAAPVWHELVFGASRLPPSRRKDTIEQYLFDVLAPSLPVLPYDQEAARWHAGERARLVSIGRTPAFVDGQIAAIARSNGLVLVTNNTRDFVDFVDLAVEDWRARSPMS